MLWFGSYGVVGQGMVRQGLVCYGSSGLLGFVMVRQGGLRQLRFGAVGAVGGVRHVQASYGKAVLVC